MAAQAISLPPYAYVPGQSPRHDEGTFDGVKASVKDGMSLAELQETQAWRSGLDFLQRGFYWEAHELLEAIWKQTPPNSPERHLVQAVIQLANARLKLRMNRNQAAKRILERVLTHLDLCRAAGAKVVMGLAIADVRHWAFELEQRIGAKARS